MKRTGPARPSSGHLPDLVSVAASFDRQALGLGTTVLALSVDDRERILGALYDALTTALAELRGMLLDEHLQRANSGLV